MADEKNLDNEFEEEKPVEELTAAEAATEAAAEETFSETAMEPMAEEIVEAEEAENEETIADSEAVDGEETVDGEEVPEEELSVVDKAVAEALAARDAEDAKKRVERAKKTKTIALIAAAVIVVGGIVGSGFVSKSASGGIKFNTYSGWLPKTINKYNHGYINVTDTTIGELSESMGIEVSDFLEEFELPADMPASTYEMVAIYNLPTRVYCQMYYTDFASLKEMLSIPDKTEDGEEINEDTPWGVALGEVPVGKYVNDTGDGEALAKFKEQHGFGDEVTAETKWKEVRETVDRAERNKRRESAKGTAATEEGTEAADAGEEAEATPEATKAAE